jgi:hypothetical protein
MQSDTTPPPPTETPQRQPRQGASIGLIRLDPRALEGAYPALAFLVANSLWSTQLAIAISFVTALVVFVRNRQRGVIGILGGLSFVIVSISAIVGLIWDSGTVFVAQNLIADFVFAGVYAVSIAIGRPLIGVIVREVVPAIKPVLQVNHPVFVQLSLVALAMNGVEGVARLWMIDVLSTNWYVVISRVVFIPVTIGFYLLCYWRVSKVAIAIWPADMPPPARVGDEAPA